MATRYMNVFKEPFEEGKIATMDALKKQYRIYAKVLHPDTGRAVENGERFVRLHDDFEEAKTWLAHPPAPIRKIGREELIMTFADLEASGFPVDPKVRASTRAYRKRIEAFDALIRGAGVLEPFSFYDVERELYLIRGDNIIDNPLFGKIRMIFYNVVSLNLEPKKFTKIAVEKWLSEIEKTLAEKGHSAAHRFLKWLTGDA